MEVIGVVLVVYIKWEPVAKIFLLITLPASSMRGRMWYTNTAVNINTMQYSQYSPGGFLSQSFVAFPSILGSIIYFHRGQLASKSPDTANIIGAVEQEYFSFV